ncbi:MAG: 16S rRNA (adenine(1518)-N(6)/adenine(1519)-N(6))-dimethyltransferase RsmA [Microscillaceae bacterium]|jgi:16S rRNA (adenine1518-N6/adenine1519-N6)-dimethyltransferase|nr:16S rRNA (adenine(1518)-N(6)/adenine(1519)-N(6))-dimethyltransferase RsmA [Microscillaceae bacterium]
MKDDKVKPKKYLGQHFLTEKRIAERIVNLLQLSDSYTRVLEIGPGMGILTEFLLQKTAFKTVVIDIDKESIAYLEKHFPMLENQTIFGDFLELNLQKTFGEQTLALIGNLPYNISSQILFKLLENRQQIPEAVFMLQKEVAERLAAAPRNKEYGILSVLLQAYYEIQYAFTVEAGSFNPPPKVRSGVIRLRRNEVEKLACDEVLFQKIVKTGFNQRRKTLRNALKSLQLPESMKDSPFLNQRAEELSVADFVRLTQLYEGKV